jgi:hypothetical protein
LGVVCTVQDVPFHRSASVSEAPDLLPDTPTAVQAVADLHDTASRLLPIVPDGLGVVCTTQEVPFHASANASVAPELFPYSPMAVQAAAELHDTPPRLLSMAPLGSGMVCTVQEVPFQISANIT